jgi:hypothetical protein
MPVNSVRGGAGMAQTNLLDECDTEYLVTTIGHALSLSYPYVRDKLKPDRSLKEDDILIVLGIKRLYYGNKIQR